MLSFLFFLGLCVVWFVVLTKGHAKAMWWKVPVFALVTQLVLGLAWRLVIGLIPLVFAVLTIGVALLVILAIGNAIFKEA